MAKVCRRVSETFFFMKYNVHQNNKIITMYFIMEECTLKLT